MNRVETGKISERVQQSAAVLAEVITEAFTASVVKFERLAEKIANAEPLFNRETALALVHAFAGMLANAEPELPKTKKERRLGINRLAILLLLLVLLAACGREGTTTVDVGVGEVTITQTTEETGEVAPEASPAPIAVTVEAENGNGDGTPPDSETIEVPEEDETPETIETPIPESKILVAAAQSGVLLSKEDISANPFISVAHKGDRRVMYRMANNNLQIIATVDAGTTVNFYQYADGTLNHDGTVTGSDGNTLGAINSEAVFTPTPAPEPAPEPGNGTEEPETPESPEEGTVEPETPGDAANSIELAQAAVGPETVINRLDTISVEIFGIGGAENSQATYRVAYNEHGVVVARYSNEQGGEFQWIAGGPFPLNELPDSHFPCSANDFNYCGVMIKASEAIKLGTYESGNALQLNYPDGTPSPWYAEAGVIGHHKTSSQTEADPAFYPVVIANSQTGQRMLMFTFSESPTEGWSIDDLVDGNISRFYYYGHSDQSALYDNPAEVNYFTDPNARRPELGFGSTLVMSYPVPGSQPRGGEEIEGNAQFLAPLVGDMYTNGNFLPTGDTNEVTATNEYMGLPVFIPVAGIDWFNDGAQ